MWRTLKLLAAQFDESSSPPPSPDLVQRLDELIFEGVPDILAAESAWLGSQLSSRLREAVLRAISE